MNNDNSYRVSRGGSWIYDAAFARVADRDCNAPGVRYVSLGLRVVRLLNPLQQLSEVLNELQ